MHNCRDQFTAQEVSIGAQLHLEGTLVRLKTIGTLRSRRVFSQEMPLCRLPVFSLSLLSLAIPYPLLSYPLSRYSHRAGLYHEQISLFERKSNDRV
jgi:hypothetical protein